MSTDGATAKSGDAIKDAIEEAIYPAQDAAEDASAETEEAVAEETEEAPGDSPDTPESETDESESQAGEELTAAGFLGIDEDRITQGEDGAMLVAVKVDGKTEMVSPSKLVENYQRESHANAKSMEAAEQRKAVDAERVQLKAQTDASLQQAAAVMELANQSLKAEFNAIDWAELEAVDPGKAALHRQKFGERDAQLQQAQQQLMQNWQQNAQKANAEQQRQQAEYLQDQMTRVVDRNPSWADESVKAREIGAIKSFLADTYALNEEEIGSVNSDVQMAIIQDAMAYRQGKANASPKLKAKVPSFQKPGQARSASASAKKEARAKRASLKKTGNAQDLAAILEDRL